MMLELAGRPGAGRRRWLAGLASALPFLPAVTGLALLLAVDARADEGELWDALASGGHFVLMRHALAPGTGDPPGFQLGDCTTQRNLSEAGRAQAAAIGERMRANGIDGARVFTSQWCRCRETAELLGLGPVRELAALNSFYQRYERRDVQTRRLKEWLAGQDLARPLVLVTHQVNITALTGVFPASGEVVVVRRGDAGGLSVVGTVETR